MGKLRDALVEESTWDKTWNGADMKKTTQSACLDLFGLAGSMRDSTNEHRRSLFEKAYNENPDMAMKLLFYIRDIRGGYGERKTFQEMLIWAACENPNSVEKNLWAILEFGYAKDLYSLIGTPVEDAMWDFMKHQFEIDLYNMKANKGVSLLAKWIATPDSKSESTSRLGKITAKKLGYSYKTMRDYKNKLRALRKYINIPEAKMCSGKWDDIEYSKCTSRFILKNRKALLKHDADRFNAWLDATAKGKANINTGTLTPYDVIHQLVSDGNSKELDVMWNNLEDNCTGNAMVMCDTSGSMSFVYSGMVKPIEVAIALSIYLSQRNKGDLKNIVMTFESIPNVVELNSKSLNGNYNILKDAPWGGSTDLEAAFDLLLRLAVKNKVPVEDMPDALIIISDMQINCLGNGMIDEDGRMTFFDTMKIRFEERGYKMPHAVFWNVNAIKPTFHASMNDAGVSFVSGYSTNVYKQVMESLGKTPYEMMLSVVESERYKDIEA